MNTTSSELNSDLTEALVARKRAGVLDIKCHVEVTNDSKPADFKRALLHVFKEKAEGRVQRLELGSLSSFDDLYSRLSLS